MISDSMAEGRETLGDNVVPSNYSITIEPDMRRFEYSGSEEILVEIKSATDMIMLNSKELEITDATVAAADGSESRARISLLGDMEQVGLKLDRPVRGSATIKLKFSGKNNDGMYGFYRSAYVNGSKKEYMLTTQFEPVDARAAFPCFDEPAFKATFNLKLVIDRDLDAISNTEIAGQSIVGGKKVVTFQTTPRMSCYLLYIGVGRFEYTTGRLRSLKIRVVTTPGKRSMARLPLEYARHFVAFYERYFGVRYPLGKLDLIAVPDFAVGAMENWGAITFREVTLLADENTPTATKQHVAEVVAHELAHQWFGDLVTMGWWDDLWLNESFATFMSYKAMSAVFPQWRMDSQFFVNVVSKAMGADALRATHPISAEIRSTHDIDSIFDEISYEKGCSVLRMLEDYAGKEAFRNGLGRYLKAHAYANATKEDLWGAIDAAAGSSGKRVRVQEVARRWIETEGYPLIRYDAGARRARLSQERFTYLGGGSGLWPIPLHAKLGGGREISTLVDTKTGSMPASGAGWTKLNAGQAGFYRVAYDADTLDSLGDAIKSGGISGADAWGIEDDLFARARGGEVKADAYLGFIEDFCMGTTGDYPVNASISGHLGRLRLALYGTRLQGAVDAVALRYNGAMLKELGWRTNPKETNTTTLLRTSAVIGLGLSGDKATIARAMELFESSVRGGKAIEPNMRGAVYAIAAWNGGAGAYGALARIYAGENRPDWRRKLLETMGMAGSPKVLDRALSFSLSGGVKLQDAFVIPNAASFNPVGKNIVWGWTRANWGRLRSTFGAGTHMLGRFVENIGNADSAATLADFERFFAIKRNARGDITRSIRKTAERMRVNIRFLQTNRVSSAH